MRSSVKFAMAFGFFSALTGGMAGAVMFVVSIPLVAALVVREELEKVQLNLLARDLLKDPEKVRQTLRAFSKVRNS